MKRLLSNRSLRIAAILIYAIASIFATVWNGGIQPVIAQGDVLLKDSFKDNANGWILATSKTNRKMSVKQGALSLELAAEGLAAWATPSATFPKDIDVRVDTVTTTGADVGKWSAAIVVRANTRDTDTGFYQFEIDGEGNWAFVRRTAKGKEYKVVESDKLSDWDATTSHELLVSTRSDKFTFAVDGTDVGTFTDDTINNDLDDTYIGLLATSFKGQDNVAINFTNLTVTSAAASSDGSSNDGQDLTDNSGTTGTGVLFKDDFAKDSGSWNIGKLEHGESSISDDALHISVANAEKNGLIHYVPSRKTFQPDVDVTVTAAVDSSKSEGKWSYGFAVHYVSEEASDKTTIRYGLLFEIVSDGTWMVTRFNGKAKSDLVVKPTEIKSFDVEQSSKLSLIATGDHYEFYLNNKKLGEVDDPTDFSKDSYKVALAASTFDDKSSVEASFTNLLISKP